MKRFSILFAVLFLFIVLGCTENDAVNSLATQSDENIDDPIDVEITADRQDRYDETFFGGLYKHNPIIVPAGSHDALAAAIAQAGHKGTVLLEAGEHIESGTVLVTSTVRILGESGAVLRFDTDPTAAETPIEVGFHVKNTQRVVIGGLEILPVGTDGGTAILIENSHRTKVQNNTMHNFQRGILIQEGNDTRIYDNNIVSSSVWQTSTLTVQGIVNINGERVRIAGNEFSNSLVGAFLCDKKGRFQDNITYGNFIGVLLCTVQPGTFIMPDGSGVHAITSCTRWHVKNNNSHDNLNWGYLVIDNANNNRLKNNAASNNGLYDIELTGDTNRFGFFAPASFENHLNSDQYPDLIIKDCGNDNHIKNKESLTNFVDNSLDPCF